LVVTEDMLPTRHWHIRDGQLVYKPHQETVFRTSSTLKEEKTWLRTISFPLKPMSFVDKLIRPSRLPVPQGKDNILKELAKDPAMMLKPRPKYEDCHAGSCSCVRLGQKDVSHRTSVLHDVCLRDGSMTEEDLAVESRFKNFVENPTHYYYWSEGQRDHLLAVPQPFRNNGSWAPVQYRPFLSDCSDEMAAQFYLDLYSKENARSIASIYMTPPSEWTPASHPCLYEPEVGSELWRHSHLLYGVESISRVNYCQHPLADDLFHLFLATDPSSLLLPVLQKDPATPSLPNKIIGRLMEPFWRRGWGQALCSVCLVEVCNGELQPVFLTRNNFIKHWEQKHLSSLVAMTTFSGTRLNSRIYQGHVLYLLALNADYSQDLTDHPFMFPTNYSGFSATIIHSDILKKAILKHSKRQPGPAPAPSYGQPAPGPSQQAPQASGPVPGPSQSASASDSQMMTDDLILSLTGVSNFSCSQDNNATVSYSQDSEANDEKLLDSNEDGADADAEPASESMLDEDDSTLGCSRMDTGDHQEFPTPTEAYLKKPPISDADAVKKAKKGGRKK
jgi:hypothetical protein